MRKKYGLLIVDDEPAARKYALSRIQWERLGITRLFEAENGIEALKILETEHPEIMILDLRMPGMDGLTLLDHICKQKYTVSVIGLSGYSDFEAARKMLSSGKVIEYLLKPASVDELFEAVTRAVEKIEEGEEVKRLRTEAPAPIPVQPPAGHAVSGRQAAIIQSVKDYLALHYSEKISLEQAAAYVYMNPSYLSRLFTEAEGIGLNKYLQKIRIEKAKELLRDPRIRVYEVADLVGYPNFQHFLKIFKQITGITPSKYRESAGWLLDT